MIIFTIYFWSLVIPVFFITFFICLLFYPFIDQKTFSRLYEKIPAYLLLNAMMICNIWSFSIYDRRRDKSWENKQYIIVANHVSFIDSMIISISVPLKKKFMIGKIFTKIPLFGWLSKMSGHVAADRHDPELNKTAVERAIKTIDKNCSFALFPHGYRVENINDFRTFKTGAFRIAHETGIPILPVTLIGTNIAMPIGKGEVNPADIVVIIDEPFYVENNNYSYYVEKTKDIIQSNL